MLSRKLASAAKRVSPLRLSSRVTGAEYGPSRVKPRSGAEHSSPLTGRRAGSGTAIRERGRHGGCVERKKRARSTISCSTTVGRARRISVWPLALRLQFPLEFHRSHERSVGRGRPEAEARLAEGDVRRGSPSPQSQRKSRATSQQATGTTFRIRDLAPRRGRLELRQARGQEIVATWGSSEKGSNDGKDINTDGRCQFRAGDGGFLRLWKSRRTSRHRFRRGSRCGARRWCQFGDGYEEMG
jgi:hypothetical protein